jgi:hypothetical protein
MNRIIKILLVSAVVGGVSYLCLEIYKLRNKIKVLTLEIRTLETFKRDHSNKSIEIPITKESTGNITNHIQKKSVPESIVHSDTEIEQEILEYEQELQTVDQLIHSMQQSPSLEEVNNLSQNAPVQTEQETIDFSNIEQQIKELSHHDTQNEPTQESEAAVTFAASISLPEVEKDDTIQEKTKQSVSLVDNESLIQLNVAKYNKTDLKTLCGNNKLSKKGTKRDLVQRLLKNNILTQTLESFNTEDSVDTVDEVQKSAEDSVDTVDEVQKSAEDSVDTVDEVQKSAEDTVAEHVLVTPPTDTINEITHKLNDMDMMQREIKQNLAPSSVLFKLQSYNNLYVSTKEEQLQSY